MDADEAADVAAFREHLKRTVADLYDVPINFLDPYPRLAPEFSATPDPEPPSALTAVRRDDGSVAYLFNRLDREHEVRLRRGAADDMGVGEHGEDSDDPGA
jgi:hypothetical protein